MKEQSKIPTSKVQRAAKFVSTGAKIGGNYLKHYSRKIVNPEESKERLHQDNAEDIYDSLSQLKGSALKVAQMLSMDKNLLPNAYQDKFMMAQYSAPPLSYPLVVKNFKKYFGKGPNEIFETFTTQAVNAASMGQVHKATLDGTELAVKVQYPGVSDSVSSDLKMVKPIALRMFNLDNLDIEKYFGEIKERLLEETDYNLELKRSISISEASKHLDGIHFPKYYPEYSSKMVITMEWLHGFHLNELLKLDLSQETRDLIGQRLWDFYEFQVHQLRMVHADPHPGNFLFQEDGSIGIIDFGCVKEIPDEYYDNYFEIVRGEAINNPERLEQLFYNLMFIYEDDSAEDKAFYKELFETTLRLLVKPYYTEEFDFGDNTYFEEIYRTGESLSKSEKLRKSSKPRGSHHALYLNRTYFGLYNMLNALGSKIKTRQVLAQI
jgi:predicted unusual protein kinase regulating ubiquinone biosynthesis (AarF/ABC1/UbiB family)